MASWKTNVKHEPSSINGGNQYEAKDRVSREQLNAITENSFYAIEKRDESLEKAESAFQGNGTVVSISGNTVATLDFNSDPQIQLDNKITTNKTISNCILEAPNGIIEFTSTSYTIKAGLKVLIPNGRNADGTLKNIEYTLPEDKTFTSGFTGTNTRFVGLDKNGSSLTGVYYYGFLDSPPLAFSDRTERYFNTKDNVHYYSAGGSTEWTSVGNEFVYLGTITSSSGNITKINTVSVETIPQREEVKSYANTLSMCPSSNRITISMSSNEIYYTAPTNGYVRIGGRGGTTEFLTLSNNTSNIYSRYKFSSTEYCSIFVPVNKGDYVEIAHGSNITDVSAYMICAEEV